jgi:hypothetical protein
VLIAASSWQKLQLLLEWAQLSRAAGRWHDHLCAALPALSEAVRQVRTAPAQQPRQQPAERRRHYRRPATLAALAAAEAMRKAVLAQDCRRLLESSGYAAPAAADTAAADPTAGAAACSGSAVAAADATAGAVTVGAADSTAMDDDVEESKSNELAAIAADAATTAAAGAAAVSSAAAPAAEPEGSPVVSELGLNLNIWQTVEQSNITTAVFVLSVQQDLQRCMGESLILQCACSTWLFKLGVSASCSASTPAGSCLNNSAHRGNRVLLLLSQQQQQQQLTLAASAAAATPC